MLHLSLLLAALCATQRIAARRASANRTRMMRPAEQWETEDIDRWLALIETFPLRDPTRR